MNILIIFYFVYLFCLSESYKILVFYPLPVRSLNILGHGAVRHLLNAGHEVTFITSFPIKNTHKNLRQIDTSHNVENAWDQKEYKIGYILENKAGDADIQEMLILAKERARESLLNENVTRLLESSTEKFDAVIVDLFESEVYAGLAILYNCPMIWIYSMGAHFQVLNLVSEPANPAYDVNYIDPHILPLTFAERLRSLWTRIQWYFYKTFITGPGEEGIYKEIFGPLLTKRGRQLPNYKDVVFNSSFIFANEHNAISFRPSTPQNFKYIGGFHIEDSRVPLPKDLQELLDKASDGFIYFSMGSFFKSKDIPKSMVAALLKMFGELKQIVIWKFEADLDDLPKNVHILKWAPQQSILAHPNIRFFITHGGLLSSIESIHIGVPTIGIPIFFDQHANMNKAVAAGYALKVNLDYDLPKNLKTSIEKMLKTDSYMRKVKELSQIYHDIPVKPGTELVHWVEHVIRTRGAPHLRSPSHQVMFYEKYYLDLIGIIAVGLIIVMMVLKKACGFFCTKKTRKVKKKMN